MALKRFKDIDASELSIIETLINEASSEINEDDEQPSQVVRLARVYYIVKEKVGAAAKTRAGKKALSKSLLEYVDSDDFEFQKFVRNYCLDNSVMLERIHVDSELFEEQPK